MHTNRGDCWRTRRNAAYWEAREWLEKTVFSGLVELRMKGRSGFVMLPQILVRWNTLHVTGDAQKQGQQNRLCIPQCR